MNHAIQLSNSPKDIITSVNFYKGDQKLILTTFSGDITIYEKLDKLRYSPNPQSIKLPSNTTSISIPILDSCLIADSLYLALANGELALFDLQSEQVIESITLSELGLQCIAYNEQQNLIIVGSWDGTISFLRPNSTKSGTVSVTTTLIHKLQLKPEKNKKVQIMDTQSNILIFTTSDSRTTVYDISNVPVSLQTPIFEQKNGFQYPVSTSLKLIPTLNGFIEGSIEGKVSVEFFPSDVLNKIDTSLNSNSSTSNNDNTNSNNYAFKCHRKRMNDGIEYVNPINDIIFIDNESKFATCSNRVDGAICVWDYKTKKRMKQYKGFDLDIVKLRFIKLRSDGVDGGLAMLVVVMSDLGFKNSAALNKDDSQVARQDSKVFFKFV
ncbi:unnamed protein product [Ambrosiozyma monospora]|uniref:Unnamed protein product n=1 Tax=Ambrosiozyma monospora TaxID=43982 RepID=A0A9W6YZQ4_AMBMO|nr:unnamed protein product [Ambrosiozyma monospora]